MTTRPLDTCDHDFDEWVKDSDTLEAATCKKCGRPKYRRVKSVTGYGALRPHEMYHLAPLEARDSIAAHGLDFRAGRPLATAFTSSTRRGNYLWDNYASAYAYSQFWAGRSFDLYKVHIRGLTLRPDPLEVVGAYVTTDYIAPDRLTRVVLSSPEPSLSSTPSVI